MAEHESHVQIGGLFHSLCSGGFPSRALRRGGHPRSGGHPSYHIRSGIASVTAYFVILVGPVIVLPVVPWSWEFETGGSRDNIKRQRLRQHVPTLNREKILSHVPNF